MKEIYLMKIFCTFNKDYEPLLKQTVEYAIENYGKDLNVDTLEEIPLSQSGGSAALSRLWPLPRCLFQQRGGSDSRYRHMGHGTACRMFPPRNPDRRLCIFYRTSSNGYWFKIWFFPKVTST